MSLKASKFALNSISTAYGLVRHEFLEFLIRVALDKYFRSGLCKTEAQAIKRFFDLHFLKHLTMYNQDKWRNDRLFNKLCEDVLIEYSDVLQAVFFLNSGKKAKPGEKKLMLLEDFLGICQQHNLLNEKFNIRQATLCFHMSLMTHVDELSTSMHMEANKMEFCEAISRLSEYIDSNDPEKDMLNYVYSDIHLSEKLSKVFNIHFSFYRSPNRKRTKIN